MTDESLERYSKEPLTETELQEIRRELEQARRVGWIWALTKRVAMWITAVAAAVVVLWDGIRKIIGGAQ